jgi:glycosyltransferase involved in cell wall biosynthesis
VPQEEKDGDIEYERYVHWLNHIKRRWVYSPRAVSGLVIIVPAFNEAASLGPLLASIRSHQPDAAIVVINDGSTDATSEVARKAGVEVLDLPFNVGIGAAVQAGLLYALRNGYRVAIQVDGDGQHPPSEIAKLIERLDQGDCDVAIGSRFLERDQYRGSLMRRAGIAVFSGVNRLLIQRHISDTTSGFRAFNRRAMEFLAADYPHDFPEPESIVTLCRNGFQVVEVPVDMLPRQGGRSSITLSRSIYYMLKVMIAIVVGATRPRSKR